MASVYKRSYLWTDPATGKTKRRKHQKWTAKFKNAAGKWESVVAYRDKQASQTFANQLETKASRQAMGLVDPFERHESTELAQHIKDFRKHLEAKENSAIHIGMTVARVEAIVAGCSYSKYIEFSDSDVEDWLKTQRKNNAFGKRTSNYYLTAIKSFTRWMVRARRTAVDPLVHLQPINVAGEVSRTRRACSAAQFIKLIDAARASTVSPKNIPGADRAMLYMVAAYTGYRAHELSSLKPTSFDLAAGTLTVEAGYSKRRRLDVQPLRKDLVEALRSWLKGRAIGEQLWPGQWYRKAAAMLQVDLQAAGIEYVENGRHLDFHALRHTYITTLHKGGTYGKLLQSLARHSTPMLTARYTHVDFSDMDAAMENLPPVPAQAPPAVAAEKPKRLA